MAVGSRAARCGTALLLALVLIVGTPAYAGAVAVGKGQDGSSQKQAAKVKAQKRAAKVKAKARARAAAERARAYKPGDSTLFNYPLSPSSSDRFRIRHQIRTAISHVPPKGRIKLATFSFDDELMADDLIRAHKRGIRVEVLIARKNDGLAAFQRLRRGLEERRNKSAPRAGNSYAKACTYSCRGKRGLVHAKMYLFSKVGKRKYVSMVGSANLTRFAAVGQWNHLNTVVGRESYRPLVRVFKQMKRDRPRPAIGFKTRKVTGWVYPRKNRAISQDPTVRTLRQVDCTYRVKGSKKVRRTAIRIAMYAWFDDRGNALARVVRNKWKQGCNVWVIYSVTNGTVLKILRSGKGRGPIPVRRTATFDYAGNLVEYNHSKYVAVRGRYGGKKASVVLSGSMNWTDLGLTSDELVVRLHGGRVYSSYLKNFNRVWRGPATH